MTNQPNRVANDPIQPQDFVFLPPEAATITHAEVEYRNKNKSPLIFGVPSIDQRFNPPVKSEVMTILSRPGHGKTTMMIALSKLWNSLLPTKGNKPPLGVYVTAEILVEEFIAVYIASASGQSLATIGRGEADLKKIDGALLSVLGDNFAVIGQSSRQKNSHLLGSGGMTLLDVYEAIRFLQKDYDVQYVIIDYLQIFPDIDRKTHSDRKQAVVSDNMGRIRALAKNLSLPVIVAGQSGREVDDLAGLKFPRMDHAQWTSAIEQDSHKVFSLTKPSDYLPDGEIFEVKGRDKKIYSYQVTPNTLGIKMLKQRFGARDDLDRWILEMDWANAAFTEAQPIGVKSEEEGVEY